MSDSVDTERRHNNFSLARAYEEPPAIDAPDEDKAYYAVSRFAIQNDHYQGLYQQWAKVLFFLSGKHWINWNARRLTYELDTDVPEWRQQPVTNYTFAVYRAAMAKMTKQRATLEVVPPSGDSEDREAAKLGEALLQHWWRALRMPQKNKRGLGWLLASSMMYMDVTWDPDAGELRPRTVLVEVPDPENPGMPPDELNPEGVPGGTLDVDCACDEEGEPYRTNEGEYDLEREPDLEAIGEIDYTILDPLSVRWNPEATHEDDAEECYIAHLWPKHQIRQKFGIDPEDIEQEVGVADAEGEDARNDFDRVMMSVAGAPPDPFNAQQPTIGSSRQDVLDDRVLVIRFYQKPCPEYPQGRHWITAGATKVFPKPDDRNYPNGEAPLPEGFWPPVVPVIDTPMPGQPTGIALLGQVVNLNEQLNYLDAKIGEFHVMMAMGGVIWVPPEDKDISVTSEPGQVKVSKGLAAGHPPIREKLDGLPAPIYAERQVLENKLRIVAGLSEADLSQRPEGVTSGRGILALQEASDAPLTPTLESLEYGQEEVGRRMLAIAQRHYTDERVIKIRGSKGQWEVRSFKGADLRDGLDVRVQVGSSFPWSKSAQFDTKLSILTSPIGAGLVVNPQTGEVNREELSRFLDAGASGLKTFETDEDPDLVEIQREHAMFEEYDPANPMKSNQLPQPAFWQNQPKHLEGHYTFMKRDYARFERWSDAAKQAFVDHMLLHAEAVQGLAQSMLPPAPAPAPGEEVPPGGESGGSGPAPPGPQGGGGPNLQLVTKGASQVPGASGGTTSPRLTQADFRAAGV